ncbi:MAG: zeta toxin family protein [Candidatus Gracilibacteria bacterium]
MDISVSEIIGKYFDDSSLSNGETPKLILIAGGPGAGKTTQRKLNYSKGYVLLDAGDIFKAICKGDDLNYEFGQDFIEIMEIIGQLVADRAIKEKRNIVMEIIGDRSDITTAIIETMGKHGYKVELACIYCDIAEAYERHLKGANEFLSSCFSEPYHIKWLLATAR